MTNPQAAANTPRTAADPMSDPLLRWHYPTCGMRTYRAEDPICDCGLTEARLAIEAEASGSAGADRPEGAAAQTPAATARIRAHARCHGLTCTGDDDAKVCRPHADGAGWQHRPAPTPAEPLDLERAFIKGWYAALLYAIDESGDPTNTEEARRQAAEYRLAAARPALSAPTGEEES